MNQITTHTPDAVDAAPVNTLPADPMVSMIERVALDPSADLDKLERMLAMKERIESTAAQTSFNEALAEAQSAMPSVVAKHRNDQTKSKYAKLADIYEACKPIAAKFGFSFNAIPVAGGREGYMNMKWTLRRGAHVETDVSEVPLDDRGMKGTANKTGTHAYGSTTSYGRRYLFCAVFDIAIGDDNDGRSANTQPITAEQYLELRDLIEQAGINEGIVCNAEKIQMLPELPAARFDGVTTKLRATIAKNTAAAKDKADA